MMLATVAVLVGFVAGVMYLLQAWRLKHKQLPTQGLRLPNLEWLQQVNSRAIVVSAIMLLAGFLSGVILNLVNQRREIDHFPWTDPVVWTSGAVAARGWWPRRCSASSTGRRGKGARWPT